MNTKQKRNKKQKLCDLYDSYCWWCGQCIPLEKLTIEHLIPQSCGGSSSLENLRLSCFRCNNIRQNSLYPPNWKKGICSQVTLDSETRLLQEIGFL